jgi:molybdopterin biosynthesis enzyme
MDQLMNVDDIRADLLEISTQLAPFEMPLLDAHGAMLAEDVYAGERLVLQAGSKIGAIHVGLAASIGRNSLPTLPQPRVVVISAGDDLIEPGQLLEDSEDEFESNSWMLTTSVKEAGATGFRVHAIPENHNELKDIVEDQLVRADLIVISGESKDESFELITNVLRELGEIKEVRPAMADSGRMNYGVIGPDKTPVITLPGDPVATALAAEIFVRPMIRTMLGSNSIFRKKMAAKLSGEINSNIGERSYVRAALSNKGGLKAHVLPDQDHLISLSNATALIVVDEETNSIRDGSDVEILILDRGGN